MADASKPGEGPRFVGIIERLPDGWRASFRLRCRERFLPSRATLKIFATELQATKWLHAQATARGCSAIEIRHDDSQCSLALRFAGASTCVVSRLG